MPKSAQQNTDEKSSEYQATEEQLRKIRDRQRRIANALPAIIWLAKPDGELQYFNDQWYTYTGQVPDSALPEGWRNCVHPDDAALTASQWAEALANGQPYENECRYRRSDGVYQWHFARATPLRSLDGSIDSWLGTSTNIHARKEAELALEKSERRFRGVFNAPLAGLSIFDASTGETLAINDMLLEMTGHDRADFDEGRWDWREFTIPEFLYLDENAIEQVLRKGVAEPYEKEFRHRNGTRFPVRISTAALEGQPGCVVIAVQNISEARSRETELRESEQRFRLAQEAAGIGVWDWQLSTNSITWSAEMYRLLDVDESTDRTNLFEAWTKMMHADDRHWATEAALNAARDGQAFSIDFRVARRDGIIRWVRSQANAVCDADGRTVRLVGINVDVTAQHHAEELLQGKADELELAIEETTRERNRVFELSSELFAAAGFDGYLKTINPSWERLLGYPAATLLAEPFVNFIHPEDRAASIDAVTPLTLGHPAKRFENRLICRDGKVVWVNWTAVAERDRFYVVGRDITQEREGAEIERQRQKMEAMGQLTGGVAHDFNNLLTPIVGALDLLQRRGIGGPREQGLIEGAAQSAERARTLVQRLLAFARRQPLQAISVDVAKLVGGLSELIASTTGPQVRVQIDLAPNLPTATADPNQLEMALLNLAVNARDAMTAGGTLSITAEPALIGAQHSSKLEPGSYLRLAVSDTGIGMDQETLARAVEPFFSTKGVGKGTGLGLSMVHGLVAQLGGALDVESRLGEGTTITLWLPQGSSPETVRQPVDSDEVARKAEGTVLLIDDEDLVRQSTADMLVDIGYQVIEASSAEEALVLLDGGATPNIIVTDHLMPGISGVELARMLKATRPSLKLLIVSGYAESEGIASDIPRLTKPFRKTDLADSLATLS